MKPHFFLSPIFPLTTAGLLLAGSQLAACSDDKASRRTRAEFCQDWAEAACSDDTVTACQAADQDTCRLSQEAYCEALVPATFSDAEGDACIDAVRDAYDDGDLTSAEIDAVRRLGGDCSRIVTGTRAEGQACDTDNDCDLSNGLVCVQRGGGGLCHVPEVVGPGLACSDPAQTCSDGFFCDGSNCIAPLEVGAPCQNDVQCEPAGYCSPADVCVARLPVGSTCTSDNDCASQLCYTTGGESTCADLIRLSPGEEICSDLR
jgi:hypothetical protein